MLFRSSYDKVAVKYSPERNGVARHARKQLFSKQPSIQEVPEHVTSSAWHVLSSTDRRKGTDSSMTGPQLKRKSDPVSHEPAWRLETTETTVCQWGGTRDQYVLAFERAIRAMLRGAPADELDDVVSTEVLRVAEGYERHLAKFPDPFLLAYVRGEKRRALWDWRRGQAVQRGAGERFGREVISLSKTYLPPKVKEIGRAHV